MILSIYVPFYLKDPDASYDVNDRDPDPQPRYTQLNDNRYEFLSFSPIFFVAVPISAFTAGLPDLSGCNKHAILQKLFGCKCFRGSFR